MVKKSIFPILCLFFWANFNQAQTNIQLANDAFTKGNFSLAESFLNQELLVKPSGLAYYNRGLTRLAMESYFSAVNDFDSSISKGYKIYDSYNRRGYAQYHVQHYQSAIEDFNKVLKENKQPELLSYAYRFISLSYIRIQDFATALNWCNKGLQELPNDPNLLFNKGFVFYSEKQYEKAIQEFDKKLSFAPNDIETLLWKVESYMKLQKFKEAQEVLEKIVIIQPKQVIAHSMLATVYQKSGQKSKFKEELNVLKSLGYQADFIDVNLAKYHIEEGNWDEALVLLNQAINKNKRNSTALLNRSMVFFHRKDYKSSLKDASQVVELDPQNFEGNAMVLKSLMELKDPKILERANGLKSKFPQKSEALYLYAKTNYILENYEEAAKFLEITLPGFAGPQTYTMLAFIYSQKIIDSEKFNLYAEKAQKENPSGKNILLLEAYAHLNEKKYDLAIQEFKKYLLDNEKDAMAISNLAYCYEQTNQLLEAKALRIKNTQNFPQNAKLFYQLGSVCYKLNDYPAANAALIECIKLSSNYYSAYLLKGVVSLALQDYGTGKSDLEIALKNLPDKATEIYPNLAFASSKLGELNDALPYLSEWENIDPKNPLVFYTRGNLYAGKNNYEKALENYSKAIELDPSNPDFLINRVILYMNNSRYKMAIGDCERILILNHKTAAVYYNLGVACIKEGSQLSRGCEAIKTAKRMGYAQAEQWLSKCN